MDNNYIILSKKKRKMNDDMIQYYARRAGEYEKIYQKPERQDEIQKAIAILKHEFANRAVFEIACGTGYWTYYISESARSVFATDINKEVIDVAKSKHYPKNNVRYEMADLYQPQRHDCDSLFGGFIWSHIPIQEMDGFLDAGHSKISHGKIVYMDNRYAEGSSTPISKKDDFGNTYQERSLSDGTKHLVLKNFPTKEYLTEAIKKHHGGNIVVQQMQYYWIASYEI
jgi:SAM-dependent methyltransferase